MTTCIWVSRPVILGSCICTWNLEVGRARFIVGVPGENSQIPCFDKICGKLALFRKYLAIYYFLSTRVSKNRVLNSTWVQWTWVPSELPACHYWPEICIIKKIMWYSILLKLSFFIVLGCHIVEHLFFFFFFPYKTFYLGNVDLFSAQLLCWLYLYIQLYMLYAILILDTY